MHRRPRVPAPPLAPPRLAISLIASATLVLLALLAPPAALAQYIYLDSNGDGVHTPADALNPAGATTIDVWLDTEHDEDGSAAVCFEPGSPLSFISYEVCLRAVDGRVAFTDFVNQEASCQVRFGVYDSATEFYAGFGAAQVNPPGLYRLLTVTATVTQGTPSMIVSTDAPTLNPVALWPPYTAFGSQCPSSQYDNTMKLGVDWFDTGDLPSATSPPPGTAPVFGPLNGMNVAVGEAAYQELTATDADGDPVTFSMISGPSFADVTTADPGRGGASGRLHVAPFDGDVGPALAEIAARDGLHEERRTVSVQVTGAPNHAPRAVIPSAVSVVAGTVWSRTILLSDADGQTPSIAMVSGPDYASAGVRGASPGGAVAFVRVGPSLCDLGQSDALFEVRDGVTAAAYPLHIAVMPEPPVPSQELIQLTTRLYPGAIAAGDLNGDALADLVVANEINERMSVFLARPGGGFEDQRLYVTGTSNSSVALGDFDEDGDLDVALTWRVGNGLRIFRNRGDGSLEPAETYESNLRPEAIDVSDLNRDGHLDLAIANSSSQYVSIFLGAGNGTFGPRHDEHVIGPVYGVTSGDWNRDGRLDLVAANAFRNPLSLLLGHGDGTFRTRTDFPAGRTPFRSVAGDWDEDGALDLAVADYNGLLVILAGNGTGAFTQTEEHAAPANPQSVTAGDLDGDGVDDLVLCDVSGAAAVVYRGDGHGRFAEAERIQLPRSAYQAAIADFNGDAVPDLAISDFEYGAVYVRLGAPSENASAFARAFVPGGHRPALSIPSRATLCVRLEPVAGSFEIDDVDPASLALVSEGTGSVDRIDAVTPKHAVSGDSDHDGAPELPVCFSQEDLSRLFSLVEGRRQADTRLTGALRSGREFCTRLRLDVVGPGRALAASVHPLPLRAEGIVSVTTTRPGRLHVTLFDPSGRLVRTLHDAPAAAPGLHEIPFDGRDRSGRRLPSGIYFYRVETTEGTAQGRLTILK